MNQHLSSLIERELEALKTYEIETELFSPVFTNEKLFKGYNFPSLTKPDDRVLLVKSIKDQLRKQGLRVVVENSKNSEKESFICFRCELYDIEQDEKRKHRKVKEKRKKERKTDQVRRAVCTKTCPCPFMLRLVLSSTSHCWRVSAYENKHIGHRARKHMTDELNDADVEAMVEDRYTHGISTSSVNL